MTPTEKEEKYKIIIKEFLLQKKDLLTEFEELKKHYQSMKPAELKKISVEVKKKLLEEQNKIKKCDEKIKQIKLLKTFPWMPVPLYEKKEDQELVQVINKNIDENILLLQLSQITKQNSSYIGDYIVIKIDNIINETVYLQDKASNALLYYNKIQLNKNAISSLTSKTLVVELYKKYMLLPYKIGEVSINFVSFASEANIEKELEFNEKEQDKAKIKITAKIRKALDESQFVIQTKSYIQITKVYPPFKDIQNNNDILGEATTILERSKITLPNKSKTVTSNQEKEIPQKKTIKEQNVKNAESKVQKEEKPQMKKKEEAPKKEQEENLKEQTIIDKSEINEEEIKDPSLISSLNTISVLNFEIDELTKKIKSIEGRTPKELKSKMLELKVKEKQIEEAIGDESITLAQYIQLVEFQIKHDKQLMEYFKKVNNTANFNKMRKRLELLLKENDDCHQANKK